MTEYETILVETRGRVGWITLNRPEALNALNTQVCREVMAAASAFDSDEGIGAIVVTGSERAFAAGADIKEMESKSGLDMLLGDHFGGWSQFAAVRTPTEGDNPGRTSILPMNARRRRDANRTLTPGVALLLSALIRG